MKSQWLSVKIKLVANLNQSKSSEKQKLQEQLKAVSLANKELKKSLAESGGSFFFSKLHEFGYLYFSYDVLIIIF